MRAVVPEAGSQATVHVATALGAEQAGENALRLIDPTLAQSAADVEVRYSLLKNRGWAELELNQSQSAEADLQKAIGLNAGRAAAHCLLAQVLSASNPQASVQQWEDCIRYSTGQLDVEPQWLNMAREKLKKEPAK